MINYCIFTKLLRSNEEFVAFATEFSTEFSGMIIYPPDECWTCRMVHNGQTTFIDIGSYEETSYHDPILMKQVLGIEHDPLVIFVSKGSSNNDPEFYTFIAAAAERFQGFVDYAGEIEGQIYSNHGYYMNEDGIIEEVYEMPTKPIDFARFFPNHLNGS